MLLPESQRGGRWQKKALIVLITGAVTLRAVSGQGLVLFTAIFQGPEKQKNEATRAVTSQDVRVLG